MFKLFLAVLVVVGFITTAVAHHSDNPDWAYFTFLTLFNYMTFLGVKDEDS